MKIKIAYNNNFITPYNTIIEKDILLYSNIDENKNIDGVLDILKDNFTLNINDLTYEDKLVLLYKLRSISIGEEISIRYTCEECNRVNESVVNVSEIVQEGNVGNILIQDIHKELNHDNFQEFIKINIDDMELEEYDLLYEECKNSITKFNFKQNISCYNCKHTNQINLKDESFVIDNMSEDTLLSLYQTIGDMIFFGHYSKLDIDNMLPFERSIFIGILNKTREKLNQ